MKNMINLILLFLVLNSCSFLKNHSFDIKSNKPAKYNIGKNPSIGIIETKGGLRSLEDVFIEQFLKSGKSSSFVVENNTGSGIKLEIVNNSAKITNSKDLNKYFLIMEIVDKEDQEYEKDKKVTKKVNGKDVEELQKTKYLKSNVIISIIMANSKKVVFNRKEYKLTKEWEKDNAPNEKNIRYEKVIEEIASNIINDLKPATETKYTKMDNDDENQQKIIDIAKSGNIDNAITEFKNYINNNPNSASANYNIATLYDLKSERNEALKYYEAAVKLNPTNKTYSQTKSDCENRIRNEKELEE